MGAVRRGTFGLAVALLAWETSARATVDPQGQFKDEVPIETAAYYGLEPALRFVYGSGGGNGFLGAGWSLAGISEIRRVSDGHGVAGSTAHDVFLFDGMELVPCDAAPAQSRIAQSPSCKYRRPAPLLAFTTRIESHLRIAFDPRPTGGEWLVWNTSGTLSRFTPTTTGVTWGIASIEDTVGHRVVYAYKRFALGTPALAYPDTITYNATVVRFVWQPRQDWVTSAQGETLLTLTHRLAAVKIETEGQTARVYAARYQPHARTGRSVLTELAEYGSDASVASDGTVTGTHHPAVALTYQPVDTTAHWQGGKVGAGALAFHNAVTLDNYRPDSVKIPGPSVLKATSFHSGDVDGDGRSDAINVSISRPSGSPTATLRLDTRLASNAWVTTSLSFTATGNWELDTDPFDGRNELVRLFVADVNGDLRDDLIAVGWVAADPNDQIGTLRLLLNVAISNGDGTFSWQSATFQSTSWTTPRVWSAGFPLFQSRYLTPSCSPGDFNGDGRADFACALQAGGGQQVLMVAYARGTGGFQLPQAITIASDPFQFETRPIIVSDVNRDGLADITYLDLRPADVATCAALPEENRGSCTLHLDLQTGLSSGGTFDFTRTETPWIRGSTFDVEPGTLVSADLDGNGRPDVLFLPGELLDERNQTIREIDAALRAEDGSVTFNMQPLPAALSSVRIEFGFGDVDGDLRTDLVVMVPIEAGGGTHCSNATFRRALVHRVLSRGDGTFALPSDWKDCALGQEITASTSAWTQIAAPGKVQVGDTNGDGLADVLTVRKWLGGSQADALASVWDSVSVASSAPRLDWTSVELSGDGRADFARVAPQGSQNWVYYRIAKPDGTYVAGDRSLPRFTHNGLRTWRWLDLNGDGRHDLAHIQCEILAAGQTCTLRIDAFISDGTGRLDPRPTFVATRASPTQAALTWQAADVDGDGRDDLVAIDGASGTRVFVRALLSSGDGQFRDVERPLDVTGSVPNAGSVQNLGGWRAGDVNGDGRMDLVHLIPGTTGVRVTTLIAKGGGEWRLVPDLDPDPGAIVAGAVNAAGRGSPLRWYTADVNGDGAADFVRQLVAGTSVYVQALVSTGRGRYVSRGGPAALPSTTIAATDFGALGWQMADMDGDGRTEMVHLDLDSTSVRATIAQPTADLDAWTIRQDRVESGERLRSVADRPGWMLGDLDGDGRSEVVAVHLTAAAAPSVEILSARAPAETDRLVGSAVGQARTSIAYGSSADFVDAQAAAGCGLPAGRVAAVVRAVTLAAGQSASDRERVTYAYACPRWSSSQRTFLGWSDVVAERPSLPNKPGSRVYERYVHGDACLSQRVGSERRDLLGHFVGERETVLYHPAGPEPPFDCQVQSRQRIQHASDPLSPYAQNSTVEVEYDEFGNIRVRRERGGPLPGDERMLARWYYPATAPYVVDHVAGEQLHDGADSAAPVLSATLFCYDGDTSTVCGNAPTRGQLTSKVELYEQGSRTTRLEYDAYGNVATIWNANQNGLGIRYDPVQHTFPVAYINALNRKVLELEWDRRRGLNTARIDENGNRNEMVYDAIARPTEIHLATGARTKRTYTESPTTGYRTVEDATDDGSADGLWLRQVNDALGRPLRVERKGSRPNETLERRFEYQGVSPPSLPPVRLVRPRFSGEAAVSDDDLRCGRTAGADRPAGRRGGDVELRQRRRQYVGPDSGHRRARSETRDLDRRVRPHRADASGSTGSRLSCSSPTTVATACGA